MTSLLIKPETYSRIFYENNKHRKEDAGFDIYCPDDITISYGETIRIDMKVKCVFRKNYKDIHYFLMTRSSIDKTPLTLSNSVGLMDKTYRGNVIASFRHIFPDKPPYKISRGQRLIQLVPINGDEFDINIVNELSSTERNTGGFGSTDY